MDSADPVSQIQVDRAVLQQLVIKLLQRKGMFAAEAEIVAARMIEADLWRRPGDGVGSLPEFLETMDLGDIDPRARIITVTETPAIAVLDGSTGMGHVAATRGMSQAMEKAQAVGTGNVVIRNSRPCGDLGAIARLAANQGLIGVIATSLDVAVDGSADTDNMAWAIPGPAGMAPVVNYKRNSTAGDALSTLGGVLCAGLAGAEPPPRKRKTVRAANSVEYSLTAISPEKFGSRDALLAKWNALWQASDTPLNDSSVSISAETAQLLAALAAKIKFAVTW